MGIAKGYVGDGDLLANLFCRGRVRDRYIRVRQRRTANLPEQIDTQRQKLPDADVSATALALASSRCSVRWP